MQTSDMNKLARPDCPQCGGAGKIRVARSLENQAEFGMTPPPGQTNAPGFKWVNCGACGGDGKR